MNNLEKYWKPLQKICEGWPIKSILAAFFLLFHANAQLVIFTVILVSLDCVTAIRAAIRRGDHVTSRLLRATVPKTIDYGIFLAVFVGAGNSFPALGWLPTYAFGFVAITEIKSIVGNLYGPRVQQLPVSLFASKERSEFIRGLLEDGEKRN